MLCIERDNRRILIADKHREYNLDVQRAFDYYFNATEPYEENGFLVANFSEPAFHKIIGFDDFPIHCQSFPESITTIDTYLRVLQVKENMTILDLGSYSGFTSIMFSKKMNGTGTIIAVEPDPCNIESTKINLERYPIKNILLEESAMYSSNTMLQFNSEGNQGAYLTNVWNHTRGNLVNVNTITLSTLADKYNLSKVDLIKCDIEGAEKFIFNDLDFFTRFKPTMVIEIHSVDIGTIMTNLIQYNYISEEIYDDSTENIEGLYLYKVYVPND